MNRKPPPAKTGNASLEKAGLAKAGECRASPTAESPWYVYILRCSDDTYYTGITTDLQRRMHQHQSGTGARYTRARKPVVLVYAEPQTSRSSAQRREAAIRRLRREEKERLVAGARGAKGAERLS